MAAGRTLLSRDPDHTERRWRMPRETSVGGHGATADALVVAIPLHADRSAEVLAQRDAGGEAEPDRRGSHQGGEPTLDVGLDDDREQAPVDRQPRQQRDYAADRDE